MNIEDYVPVYTASGKLAAEMVRLMLESFGIDAILAQESLGGTYGLTVGPLGETDILVHNSQLDEAKSILSTMEEGGLQADSPSADQDQQDSESQEE